MTKRSKIVAFAALAVPAAVLAYGYWFGVTHGSLYIGVDDVTDREHPQRVAAIEMSLLDAAGQTLAEARSSPPYGTISIVAPELYDCHAFEGPGPASSDAQQQWQACFERQSRWLPTWIRNTKAVKLRAGSCAIDRLPIVVSEHPDTWWLWWVPLPHIGGKPYTSFGVNIALDRASCPSTDLSTPRHLAARRSG